MAGQANDPPDTKMLELATPETTNPKMALESSSANIDGSKSNGTLTMSLPQGEYFSRTSRESVLRRLSEALMRHSLAKVRSTFY
jgi:leucyl aminopeptidase (aminopeptidase T)